MENESQAELETVLARRLRAARVLSGKSVAQLASELGERWTRDKVYRVERGDQVPDTVELVEYARATGQPIEFFLSGATTSSPPAEPILTHSGDASQEETQ